MRPCVQREADWESRTGRVAGEGSGLVDPHWTTPPVEGAALAPTEVGAADEMEQIRGQCSSWSWRKMKRK